MEEVPPALIERVCRTSVAAGATGGLAWLLASANAKLAAAALATFGVAAIVVSVHLNRPPPAQDLSPAPPDAVPQTESTAAPGPESDSTQNIAASEAGGINPSDRLTFRLGLVDAGNSRPIADANVVCDVEPGSSLVSRELKSDARGLYDVGARTTQAGSDGWFTLPARNSGTEAPFNSNRGAASKAVCPNRREAGQTRKSGSPSFGLREIP